MVKSNHHIASVNIVLVVAILAIGFMVYSAYSPSSQVSVLEGTIEESSALAGQAMNFGKGYGKSESPPFDRGIITEEEEIYWKDLVLVKADRDFNDRAVSYSAVINNIGYSLGEINLLAFTGSAMTPMASGSFESEKITLPNDLTLHYKVGFKISDIITSIDKQNFMCKLNLNEYNPTTGEISVISSWMERFGYGETITGVETFEGSENYQYHFNTECYFSRTMYGEDYYIAKIILEKLYVGEDLSFY